MQTINHLFKKRAKRLTANMLRLLKQLSYSSRDPILKSTDFTKTFTLTTDASSVALGAVLSQGNHVICFAIRTLNYHEVNYSGTEKELIAIFSGLHLS